jgi:NitT/TauT family transport system substrate-binding protein
MRLSPAGTSPQNRSHRPLRARLSLAAVSAIAVLAAAGCSGAGAATATVSTTITIAAVPGIDDAPIYLALKDGLFAAAGLKHVVIKSESQESAEFDALRSNQAQIAAADYGTLLYQQGLAPDYKILADGYDAATGSLEVLTLPNSGISTPAQLVGAKVAVPDDDMVKPSSTGAPASLQAAAATEVLQSYTGSSLGAPHWMAVPEGQEVSDLMTHRDGIQAILVGQPYVFEAERDAGAVEIMDACSGGTADLPLSGYAALTSWVKDHQAAVADFQSAMASAQAQASMVGPIQKVLPAFTGMTVQEADLATIGTYPTSTNASGLERVDRMMWQLNMIKSQVSIPQMIVR